jgi:4a-hydroxytetrahydrobiopterin dehydratase
MPGVGDAPDLLAEQCVACQRDAPHVTDEEAAVLTPLIPDWSREEQDGVPRLVRTFRVPTFRDALAFTQRVGELAEL